MIKLTYNKQNLEFETVTWSGTDNQASREITFTLPSNPYDKDFGAYNIKLGDIVTLSDDENKLFVGVVTSRERSAAIGTASYTARDYMHYLLRSQITKIYKKKTAEEITKSICKQVGVSVGSLAKTGINIKKMVCDGCSMYDVIIRAYRKAKAKNNKKYMPIMEGKKLSVIEKNVSSGITLDSTQDILEASYTDSTDNMVNKIIIVNSKKKKKGEEKNAKQLNKYGTYQGVYTKKKGENAHKEAKALLVGITEEATIEAIGNVNAIAGRSIKIKEPAVGLTGTFYISSDSHTFSNGIHTMSLELVEKNKMESV